jgi:hypothetical protein
VSKAYVITRLNYEYNDEYSHQPEGGGGDPEIVLTDKAKAEAKLDELEFSAFKETASEINNYDYGGLSETCRNVEKFLAIVNEGRGGDVCPTCKAEGTSAVIPRGSADAHCDKCGADWLSALDEDDLYIPDDVTDDQLRRLRPLVSVNFYELTEVELVQ